MARQPTLFALVSNQGFSLFSLLTRVLMRALLRVPDKHSTIGATTEETAALYRLTKQSSSIAASWDKLTACPTTIGYSFKRKPL
jgi:hypothetical protein